MRAWVMGNDSGNGGSGDERRDEIFILALGVMLLLCLSTSYLYSLPRMRRLKLYFTEPAAQIVVGMICYFIVPVFPTLHSTLTFKPETFFLFLLPPIVFASGYNMSAQVFFANIGVIFLLGIIGTLLCTVLMALTLIALAAALPSSILAPLTLEEALLFGNALSAVDSIATVSVFTQLGVPSTLFTLVFGESVVNDAAAIVAYDSFGSILSSGSVTVAGIALCLAKLVGVCIGSVSVGTACGAACALVLKHTSIHREPPLEIAVFWIFPLLSYFAAELLGLSGVMSILFAGTVMGHYSYYNLSLENQVSTPVSTTIVAFLCESFVFLYLGGAMPSAAQHLIHDIQDSEGGLGLLIASFLLCYASRGLVILVFCSLANLWRRKPITRNMQVVMWLGGAMRGAVSYALALKVPAENSSQIWTATLFVVAVTTLIAGAGTTALINSLKASGKSLESSSATASAVASSEKGRDAHVRQKLQLDDAAVSPAAGIGKDSVPSSKSEATPLIRKRREQKGPGLWRRLDDGILIPFLRADSGRRISSVPYVSPCKGTSPSFAQLFDDTLGARGGAPLDAGNETHSPLSSRSPLASRSPHTPDGT